MHAVEKIIQAAGGPHELAAALCAARPNDRVTRDDVYNWRRRQRIPGRFLLAVHEVATGLGCEDLLPEIEAATASRSGGARRAESEAAA